MNEAKLNLSGLENVIKMLKTKPPKAKVGIIGSKNPRKEGGLDNATIGAWHEFGTSKTPQRSFLRIPLADHLQKSLENSGAFTTQALQKVVADLSFKTYVEKMAVVAVGIVLEGFNSNGYGKWKSLTASTIARKRATAGNRTGVPAHATQVLVATGQLRDSIFWEMENA